MSKLARKLGSISNIFKVLDLNKKENEINPKDADKKDK
jgi:hypothetical protein